MDEGGGGKALEFRVLGMWECSSRCDFVGGGEFGSLGVEAHYFQVYMLDVWWFGEEVPDSQGFQVWVERA